METFAELGEAGSVVHKIVQRQGTDLVMLATHGHGPVRRFLLASVTGKLLHDVGATVWTGAGTALTDHAPRIPYKSIVCALDDSDEAEAESGCRVCLRIPSEPVACSGDRDAACNAGDRFQCL